MPDQRQKVYIKYHPNNDPNIAEDYLQFDAMFREGHGFISDVVDQPLESGSVITDHIRPEPQKVFLDAFVTDHPIGDNIPLPNDGVSVRYEQNEGVATQAFTTTGIRTFSRVKLVRDLLFRMRNEGWLLEIISPWVNYENMYLYECIYNRLPGASYSTVFQLSFRELTFVNTITDPLSGTLKDGRLKNSGGRQKKLPNDAEHKASRKQVEDVINPPTNDPRTGEPLT